MRFRVSCLLAAALLALLPACSGGDGTGALGPARTGGPTAATRPFDGIALTAYAPAGTGLPAHAARWSEKTGARVTVKEMAAPWSVPEALDGRAGGPKADVVVYPAFWAGDLMPRKLLRPTTPDDLTAADWDDIFPSLRDGIASWNGTAYAFPIDADVLLLYYRVDVFARPDLNLRFQEKTGRSLGPPRSWQEYVAIAEFLRDGDWNGDGETDAAAVEPSTLPGPTAANFLAHASAYAKRPGQPAMLFDPETFEPRIADPPFVQALSDWISIQKLRPSSGFPEDSRAAFLAGRAAMCLDGADLGPLAVAKDSAIATNVGFSFIPGTLQVFDSARRSFESFDRPQFSPCLAPTTLLASVSAKSDHPEAAARWLADLCSKDESLPLVTPPGSALNPFRAWHFSKVSDWINIGFTRDSARDYLGAVQASLRHANVSADFRFPEARRYLGLLEAGLATALQGESTPEDVLGRVKQAWQKTTESLGLEAQKSGYRESLGLAAGG